MKPALKLLCLLGAVAIAGGSALATEPCLPGFDTPLTEMYRDAGGDLHVAATGIGTEDGARQILIDVPGTPVAAWIYWVGETRVGGGPDDSITLDGGALPVPLDLYGIEVGRRNQIFSDEIAGGCAGNGGEVVMRAELPLDAFHTGSNSFVVSNFNEPSVVCNGQQRNTYRRQFGVEIVVVYRGQGQCPAAGGDDDSSDDDSSDDRSAEDDDSGRRHGHGKSHRSDDDHSSDDASSDDDSSDDSGRGSAACEREVILLDGADIASFSSFAAEPDCGPQSDSEVVCFAFDALACDGTGDLIFGVGGTTPRQTPTATKIRVASQEQTWFEAGLGGEPATLIGIGQPIEIDQLIDSNFYYDGRKLSVYSGTFDLPQGTTRACFQIDLLPVKAGEQPQHTVLFDAALTIDRTCGATTGKPPCDCDDDSSSDDHDSRARDDRSGDDDSSDDCSCDDDSSDDDSSDG